MSGNCWRKNSGENQWKVFGEFYRRISRLSSSVEGGRDGRASDETPRLNSE